MSELAWIILIYCAGLAAMILELFMPGAVVGITGFLAVCGSIVFAFTQDHTTAGTLMLAGTILFLPLFFLLWKNVLGRFFAVTDDESEYRSTLENYEELLGKEGVAASPLRPSGTAVIEGRRRAVITRGEMLEKGTPVKIIQVNGSRLTVKALEP